MKFVINEIKLWYNDGKFPPRVLPFEPNKINVVKGNMNRGKSSIFSIIDYCLMSKTCSIPDEICAKVSWFGLVVTIGSTKIAIARRTPVDTRASGEYYVDYQGYLPEEEPVKNQHKTLEDDLNSLFNLNPDSLKELGKIFGYRTHLFSMALTDNVIKANVLIDSKFSGIDSNNFREFVYPLLGVGGVEFSELDSIEKDIKSKEKSKEKLKKELASYKKELGELYSICNQYKFIDNNMLSETDALSVFREVEEMQKQIDSSFSESRKELTQLQNEKLAIEIQIGTLKRYKREYKRTLDNAKLKEDSMRPIKILADQYADEVMDIPYVTKSFVDNLSSSLSSIKQQLKEIPEQPYDIDLIDTNLDELESQLTNVKSQIETINSSKDVVLIADYLIKFGEVAGRFKKLKGENSDFSRISKLEEELSNLVDRREELDQLHKQYEKEKYELVEDLNKAINNAFSKLETLANNYKLRLDTNTLKLDVLTKDGRPVNNWGGSTNDVLKQLSFYIGFHQCANHREKTKSIPAFMFIDQPCSRCQGNGDTDRKTIDKIVGTLNDFVAEFDDFQVILVEHIDESYWKDKYDNFVTQHIFEGNEGLIPCDIFNSL